MAIKQRRQLRRVQHVLFILLPILVILLVILMFISLRISRPTTKMAAAPETSGLPQEFNEVPKNPSVERSSSDEAVNTAENDPQAETEPIRSADDTSVPEEVLTQEPTTLLFTGDVLLSGYVLENYNRSGIEGVISPALLSEMREADLTIINNEFPFSTRGTQAPDKQYTFRIDPNYVSVLTDMGVDIAGIANNHVLDYGSEALEDTFATFDSAGIDYMGAGDSLERASALIKKEVNGKTFGFLAASRVIPVVSWDVRNAAPGVFTTYDPELLLQAIRAARAECDYLSVFVHWGIERDAYPQDYQVTMAKQYIDAGADLVIGAHPHVLQGITYYENKPIFYSLGNFIFNQEIARTAAVKVTVEDDAEPRVQIIPASASGACTSASEGSKKDEILSYLESISEGIHIDTDGFVTSAQ